MRRIKYLGDVVADGDVLVHGDVLAHKDVLAHEDVQGWAFVLFKRTFRSHVHLRSFQKNVSFSAFMSVLCTMHPKRM